MAKKVVKKKKKKKGGFASRASSGKETSPLRPYKVPRHAPCMTGCPAGNDCREFVTIVAQAEKLEKDQEEAFTEAFYVLAETSPLPSVCGRVCPHPCESDCNRTYKDGAVGINKVERFLGDWAIEKNLEFKALTSEKKNRKVAVVGSGPAGLGCAYHLARRGYQVTVFETLDALGGMLAWGIPPYRLPREVLNAEIERIGKLGVEFKTNTRVGSDVSFEQVKKDFDAVYVAIGAHKGYKLGLKGEEAPNVMTGADFLRKIYSGETIDVGDDVVVIGGGNTAIDAASVARRLGANTTILYRRTEAEMPAIEHEIELAKEDGINFEFLAAPVGITVEDGKAAAMTCIKMELGEPDASGRRRPVPIEGSEYERKASFVIPAIAQEPNFDGLDDLREGKDWIKANEKWETKQDRVFAGGDAVDAGLVTIALGQGRKAADAIHCELAREEWKAEEPPKVVGKDEIKFAFYEEKPRIEVEAADPAERIKSMEMEVIGGFTPEQVVLETRRCMSCGKCFQCDTCYLYCQDGAVKKMGPGQPYEYDFDLCQGCKKCAEECPCAYLEMR